jgi:RNA polymerase sigma factor (sigma-70 family)
VATTKDRALLRQLDTLFNIGAIRELTDGQLLERFARGDGEAAELAFAALVERHGAMVLRVCRAQLADPHETQDAFQATFLVLVEKARGLWVRDSLGPWLHQVALRTASCARSAEIRRRRLERRAAEIAAVRDSYEDPDRSDLQRALHEEIGRLPERYRLPIVLCDLEGRTCEEAARMMGRPVGTVKCWRSRGRERLRNRLIRAGLAPSAALASDVARAAVPKVTAEQTVAAAVRVLSDRMTAGGISASVSALVKGVLKSMLLSRLRTTLVALCALTFLGAGLAAVPRVSADDANRANDGPQAGGTHPAPGQHLAPPVTTSRSPDVESWPLSLRDAIRIALDNNGLTRVLAFGPDGKPIGGLKPTAPGTVPETTRRDPGGASIVITRLNADATPWRFQAEVTAEVRSVEQQYWNFSAARVQLAAAEKAVHLAEDAMKREQERRKAGRGSEDELAEARQRLEQFRLDLVTRTSDTITAERQLRNLLGLPPAGNRRIVPVTPPTEARLEPDWEKSRAVMLEKHPEIFQAREVARQYEGRAGTEELNRTTMVQQVVHQLTHSLARFFLEIDANYKQFQAGSRLRAAAAQRLDARRADYEAGRILVDRFLDAVSQHVTAVATEAQYKATYNISIVALEEAKGTLLEYDKIAVIEPPKEIVPPDGAVRRAAHQPTAPVPSPTGPTADAPIPLPAAGPIGPRPAGGDSPAKDDGDKSRDAGKTYSFYLTIGAGSRPIEIRGSFTVAPAQAHDVTQPGAR